MSELTPAYIKKLKVAELRTELTNLGLETKGTKPVLLERLLQAITSKAEDDAKEQANNGEAVEASSQEESSQESQDESVEIAVLEEPVATEEPTEKQPTEQETEQASEQPTEEANENVVEEVKITPEEKPISEVLPDQVETKDESKPSVEDKETPMEVPTDKVEETKADPKETEGEKKDESKDEAMDQTPALATVPTPTQSKDAVTEQQSDDLDVSVDISKVEEEPEVELDDSLVVLDKYNCDLHIKISPEALTCQTLKEECFAYLSGGARATWGVTSGKVCYEVKVTALHEVDLSESEEPKQSIRVGWSVDAASLQLGEDILSYGFDSSGKKCTNLEFSDFAEAFGKDDVISCYLDLESEVKKISFSKNGEDVGEAFELSEDIEGKALFPHVFIKNAECAFNFGSQEEAWFAAKEGYTFIQHASDDTKVHGTCGPSSKQDCEVMMMIGLPASGKSTHVGKHVAENPDKKYNILGTSSVLGWMKLFGVPRKQEAGGYNKYMDKAAKCLHRLFEIAPSKKRNYILDQTNVYMSAQNKKMRPFEGFKRKSLVCIPSQDVMKQRMEDRKTEGTELPHNAICDMKRSFTLPQVGELFDEVIYVDQDEEASKAVVLEYVKEGTAQRTRSFSGEPERKRPRQDDRPRYGGYGGGGGGGGWNNKSPRDNRYDDRRGGGFRGSHYQRRGSSPNYGGRGGRGNYRDNYRGGRGGGYNSGGYQDRRSYGGSHGGYGGGKSYGGGKHTGGGSYGSGSNYGGGYSNQQSPRQQYSGYSNQYQSTSQPAQQQYSQPQHGGYYQNYQQYGQQQTPPATSPSSTHSYPQQQQQYSAYYQQPSSTYQQGGYGSGYGY